MQTVNVVDGYAVGLGRRYHLLQGVAQEEVRVQEINENVNRQAKASPGMQRQDNAIADF